MIGLAGNIGLCVAIIACAYMALRGVLAVRAAHSPRPGHERFIAMVLAASMTMSMLAMLAGLLSDDMRLEYVAAHSTRATNWLFKVAALWSGQEGSLLLWAWYIAVMTAVIATKRRSGTEPFEAPALGVLAFVCGSFIALMFFAANPFASSADTVADGRGLNPLLRHWAMVAHPPMLFAGYASCTVPFAMMIGALVSGRFEGPVLEQMRKWALFAWITLGAGIALGAWWAYEQLGWGGYWAWDPVENASLLPWLTTTALLHTIMVHQRRGVLRGWTASLCALTFLLCIVGTYLTRSGIVQSVHAFGTSSVGTFFLAFGIVIGAAIITLLFWRRRLLRGSTSLESPASREGIIFTANVLLLLMAGATLLGTLSPLVSGMISATPVGVDQGFYNRLVVPLGLCCAALMAIGHTSRFGSDSPSLLLQRNRLSFTAAFAIVAVLFAAGLHDPIGLGCAGVSSLAIISLVAGFVGDTVAHARHEGSGWARAALLEVSRDSRRVGARLAHLGMAIVIIGIAGSSILKSTHNLTMHTGESCRVGSYLITFERIGQTRGADYTAVEATLVATSAGGSKMTLSPQRRFYDLSENSTTEVAIRSRPSEDLYAILAGWEAGGTSVGFQIHVNPLAIWIWIGAVVMIGGGLIGLAPRVLARTQLAPVIGNARPSVAGVGSKGTDDTLIVPGGAV